MSNLINILELRNRMQNCDKSSDKFIITLNSDDSISLTWGYSDGSKEAFTVEGLDVNIMTLNSRTFERIMHKAKRNLKRR